MAIKYLLELATTVVVAIFILRFLLQLTRADFYNPASLAIVRFTNPIVMPLRKLIPGWGGLDVASLVAAVLLQALSILGLAFFDSAIRGYPMPGLVAVLIQTPLKLALLTIQLYTILIFLRILMSWLSPDPRNPAVSLLYSLTEPVLRPARRLLPPIAGFDLSPIIVLIAFQALRIFLEYDLVSMITR